MAHSPHDLDRLRLRHLRLRELIDRHRTLRAVGGVLKLTQPENSQMVKDLEHAFGVRLVERSARGVTLTPVGELALQRTRSGLAAFDHLGKEVLRLVQVDTEGLQDVVRHAIERVGGARRRRASTRRP